ncbi:hypothetical protein MHC_01205 [Mycoplasma haemocanis str. Illinois]|uniref:Uncharacterized protein n=1 Tax=Mycoplasma haemocanis (strain Illinois) TaxID=1111676 RepID=H6N635_MYCHN|nr:hypothetical protein [Mycoplasma haemocanis]AEW45107.1 hypothetical protein MHC_01205 [Mycoplasma haemocanis str. Illinois]
MERQFQTVKEAINQDFFFNNLSNRIKDLIDFWKLSSITQFLEVFLFALIIVKQQSISLDPSDFKAEGISISMAILMLLLILFSVVNVIDIYKQVMTAFAINRVINISMIDGDIVKLNELRIVLIASLSSIITRIIFKATILPFLGMVSFGIKGFFYWKSIQLRKINLIS